MCSFLKKINALLLTVFITVFFLVITIGSVSGQSVKLDQQNCLILKGKILNGYTAEIAVFQYFYNTGKWVMMYSKKNKTRYSLQVNPQLNYQIFFLGNNGEVKVLHIDAGNKGMWEKEVDIDFDLSNLKHAKMYQIPNKKDYHLVIVSNDYMSIKQND